MELEVRLECGAVPPGDAEHFAPERLRAALEQAFRFSLSLLGHQSRWEAPGHEDDRLDEGLHSDISVRGADCILHFGFSHPEPSRSLLFEHVATDLIQSLASAPLLHRGFGPRALLPWLHGEEVAAFWGSFAKHAPAHVTQLSFSLNSPTGKLEKRIDEATYSAVVTTNFDELLADLPDPSGPGEWADALERASAEHDEEGFTLASREIDWSHRTAEDFLKGVRLALEAGAHRAARELSEVGSRQHPESADLARFAQVLAPPRIVGRGEASSAIAGNHRWVRENAARYQGQWVALKDGELVRSATTVKDITDEFGSLDGLFVTRIR